MWRDGRRDEPYAQPRPDGLTYSVARGGETILVPDLRAHPLFADAPAEWEGAIVGLPLKIVDRVVGVMNVGYPQPRAFEEAEQHALRVLGDQAAIAIENARLYEALRRQAEELEQRVAERTEELDAYTHTIAHNLKSPLHLLSGYVSLMEMDEHLSPDGREYLQEIDAASNKMVTMIDQLLWLAQVRDAASEAVRVEVAPLVMAALARFKDRVKARGIAVHVTPDLPAALGHGPWIEEVFANLICNPIKNVGQDNPAPRISIQGIRQGDVARYEVQDNGIGIAPEDQTRLFQMYTRLQPSHAEGLGLGLSIVHRIVTKLNGEVGVKSMPGEGSIFWFTLPAPEA
jgi:signal transduction histidine kinase